MTTYIARAGLKSQSAPVVAHSVNAKYPTIWRRGIRRNETGWKEGGGSVSFSGGGWRRVAAARN